MVEIVSRDGAGGSGDDRRPKMQMSIAVAAFLQAGPPDNSGGGDGTANCDMPGCTARVPQAGAGAPRLRGRGEEEEEGEGRGEEERGK